jgi:hypothetical protein
MQQSMQGRASVHHSLPVALKFTNVAVAGTRSSGTSAGTLHSSSSSVMTSSRGQTRNSVLGPGKQENIPDVFFLLKIPDVLFLFGLAVIQYRL